MPVQPVSPLSVPNVPVDIDRWVEQINEHLCAPWSAVDRLDGRAIDASALPSDILAEVVQAFRDVGWHIQITSKTLVFRHVRPLGMV